MRCALLGLSHTGDFLTDPLTPQVEQVFKRLTGTFQRKSTSYWYSFTCYVGYSHGMRNETDQRASSDAGSKTRRLSVSFRGKAKEEDMPVLR